MAVRASEDLLLVASQWVGPCIHATERDHSAKPASQCAWASDGVCMCSGDENAVMGQSPMTGLPELGEFPWGGAIGQPGDVPGLYFELF